MIKIVIKGEPIPAARPRFSGRSCYQPKRNREFRQEVQASAMAAMSGRKPLTGEICAAVKLYRRYKRSARILNQIAFVDDSQIVRCVVEKFTDKENPRAEIILSSV